MYTYDDLHRCGVRSPNSDQGHFVCSREPNHTGDHFADGVGWPDKMCTEIHGIAHNRVRCGLEEGHTGKHKSICFEW
jgi:hypothetical protein